MTSINKSSNPVRVTVLGAGISGLSCAYRILTSYPDIDLTLISKDGFQRTTSYAAAGIWRPDNTWGPDADTTKLRRWYTETREYYENLIATGQDYERGLTSVFLVKMNSKDNPAFDEINPIYKDLTKCELKRLFPHLDIPDSTEKGNVAASYTCRPAVYIPWMESEIKKMGGKFIVGQVVESVSNLKDKCDILINCCGIAARELFDDSLMVPIRGQVTLVRAPWVSYGISYGYDAYILPGFDGSVTLGGCYQSGNDDLSVDYELREQMLEKCYKVIPSLKKSTFIRDMVGLRPMRLGGPRVEMEILPDCKLHVIHNYGHGAEGWALHWGTSGDVVDLFKQWMGSRCS